MDQCLLLESLPTDQRLIQRTRQIWGLIQRLALMMKLKVQPLPQKLQRGLRVGIVGQESGTILDHAALRRLREAGAPLFQDLIQLRLLPGILKMQRVEEV